LPAECQINHRFCQDVTKALCQLFVTELQIFKRVFSCRIKFNIILKAESAENLYLMNKSISKKKLSKKAESDSSQGKRDVSKFKG
jgi:hypothetical protein